MPRDGAALGLLHRRNVRMPCIYPKTFPKGSKTAQDHLRHICVHKLGYWPTPAPHRPALLQNPGRVLAVKFVTSTGCIRYAALCPELHIYLSLHLQVLRQVEAHGSAAVRVPRTPRPNGQG